MLHSWMCRQEGFEEDDLKGHSLTLGFLTLVHDEIVSLPVCYHAVYRKHEEEKIRQYEQKVLEVDMAL